MIGLVLLYFMGRAFYQLAEAHQKSKWGVAILGIAVYYAALLVSAFLVALVMLEVDPYSEPADFVLTLIALPFALAATWGFHRMLKKRWENESGSIHHPEILDADM